MSERDCFYKVSVKVRVFRWLFRPIFRFLFRALSRVEIRGLENIPRNGAYMIAINHISIFEPPFVLAFWPKAPEAVGAREIWSRRGQSFLARIYGGIPVRRGEYDRQLLETMIAVLKSGRALLIAPEGGRSHTPGLRRAYPGVAYVLEKARVPVVPVGITGSTEDFLQKAMKGQRPCLQMCIGKPFLLPPLEAHCQNRRIALRKNADMIMVRIAELLPPEYQGVYADGNLTLIETA